MDITRRQITKIAREANKLTVRMMKETGVGSGEFDLIHLVRHNPGISQKQISRELNMDKGAVARRVINLEKKGYLERRENPADKRSQFIYATGKADCLKHSKAFVEAEFYSWLLEDLEPDEQAVFAEILGKLYLKSKFESRAGFPALIKRLTERQVETGKEG